MFMFFKKMFMFLKNVLMFFPNRSYGGAFF